MNTPLHPEHDDLERQLQAQLEHYAPEAPDRLWAGIEARLPRRRRRTVFWWWASGVGAALILVGFVYRFIGESDPSAPKPRDIEIKTSVQQDIAIRSPQERTGTEMATVPALISRTTTNSRNTGLEIVAKPAAHPKAIQQDEDILPVKAPAPGILLEKPPLTNAGTTQILPVATFDATPLEPLCVSLPLVLKNDSPQIQFIRFPVKTIREWRWQIEAAIAPVWLWQTAARADPHHAGHIGFAEHRQGAATGWQAGLNVGYEPAPRWQVIAGLFRRQTTQIASHTAMLRLMDGVCLNPNDYAPKEYEFQYDLYSGSGTSNLTVHIAQVDTANTMPDDEPFTLDMRTTRSSSDWVLPLGVKRTFSKGLWQGFVQGGIQINLPGSASARVDHFTEACVDLCFATGRVPALTVKENRQTSIAWTLGLGAEYRLSKRWILSTTPTLFGNKGQMGLSLQAGLNLKI
ncbi:MAG: hypothetical protein IPM81_19935 [Saprospirales bacterium]|nr:hypothetical protein [Saprospirales bacterium]